MDGGNFLKFKDRRAGLDAATRLLVGPLYNGLSIDAALRKWSNGGYGGELAQAIGIDPKLRIRDLSPNQITQLTQAMADAESGITSAPVAAETKSPFGTTTVPSPGGIAEVPAGTPMSIPNAIYRPPGGGKAPTRRGTAEAATPPASITVDIEKQSPSVPTQIADLLNLPMPASTERAQEPASLTVDVEKQAPPLTRQEEVRAVKARYDLRGLNPEQVDAVVGRALEARRIAATANAANSQLIETEDGYVLIDKKTGTQVPLTSSGKIDAKQLVADERTRKLSAFSQEMSAPDYRVRGKMNETQAKALEFGSRALQANERQRRLELKYDANPEKFANARTHVLSVLESLSPEIPLNVVGTVVGTIGAAPDVLKGQLDALTAAGLGPAAARVMAALRERGNLTADEREFLQNQVEFATAMLRRESGAAINVGEFLSTHRTYFPTVGDTQRDVLRKMRTRQQAIRGLRSSAGRPLLVPDVED